MGRRGPVNPGKEEPQVFAPGYHPEELVEIAQRPVGQKLAGALSALGWRRPNPILSLEVLTTAAIPFPRISPAGCRRLRDGAQVGLEWRP